MTEITVFSYDHDKNTTFSEQIFINEPRQCMHCHETGKQNYITGMVTDGGHDNFDSIYLFTCALCSSTTVHFSAIWYEQNLDFSSSAHHTLRTFPPKKEKLETISIDLQKQFPDFFAIYSQSNKAEKEGLDQIAGMGYRKALEFLVTDYLLAYPVNGVEEDWLKDPNTSLGNKILKIESTRIKNLARAISFIGNDETHYSRRHPEHDVESMKAFIRVLLSEIQNEIDYKNAEALINKPKS